MILSKARAENSVHYTSWAWPAGAGGPMVISADVAQDRGVLRMTFHRNVAHGKTHRFALTVVVIGDSAYVRGRAAALEVLLDAPAPAASQYADRWISIHYGGTITEGATLGSFLRSLRPHGRLKTSTVVEKGRRFIGVVGTHAGERIYLDASSSSLLPTRWGYATVGWAGGHGVTRISRWNEPIHVSTPTHVISGTLLR
jgi:hypothetical protein